MASGHFHSDGIDAYAGLKSPIHQWDSRFKVVGLLGLIVAFASVQNWVLLPILLVTTAILYAYSRMPWHALRHRLTIPGYIVVALVIFLPFISGDTVLATIGPLTLRQEGLALGLLIAGRLFCIVTLAFIMFGTDSFIRTMSALRALRFPDIMADMILLTYRYLFEIGNLFAQMQTSATLRGFQGRIFSLGNIGTLSALVGHLFIRSYDKSERVYKAMVLRGYGVGGSRPGTFTTTTSDYAKTILCLIIAILLLIGDRML